MASAPAEASVGLRRLAAQPLRATLVAHEGGLFQRLLDRELAPRLLDPNYSIAERASLRAPLEQLAELAAHSIEPAELCELLMLFRRSGEVLILETLAHAVARAERCAGALGAPLHFLAFDSHAVQLTLPPLQGPYLGSTSLSIWLWLRVEDEQRATAAAAPAAPAAAVAAVGPPKKKVGPAAGAVGAPAADAADAADAGGGHQRLFALLSSDGLGLEISIHFSGRLTVRVMSSKGGSASLQCDEFLPRGSWHWLSIELEFPRKRWPWRLPTRGMSVQPAARLVIRRDGALQLEQPLALGFDSSTLRFCTVGGSTTPESGGVAKATAAKWAGGGGGAAAGGGGGACTAFSGQLGELLLIPSSTGGAKASRAAAFLRERSFSSFGASLRDAAIHCGLAPSLSLSPSGVRMLGNGDRLVPLAALVRCERPRGERAGRLLVARRTPLAHALIAQGGVKLLVAMLLLLANRGKNPTQGASAELPAEPPQGPPQTQSDLQSHLQSELGGAGALLRLLRLLLRRAPMREQLARCGGFKIVGLALLRLAPTALTPALVEEFSALHSQLGALLLEDAATPPPPLTAQSSQGAASATLAAAPSCTLSTALRAAAVASPAGGIGGCTSASSHSAAPPRLLSRGASLPRNLAAELGESLCSHVLLQLRGWSRAPAATQLSLLQLLRRLILQRSPLLLPPPPARPLISVGLILLSLRSFFDAAVDDANADDDARDSTDAARDVRMQLHALAFLLLPTLEEVRLLVSELRKRTAPPRTGAPLRVRINAEHRALLLELLAHWLHPTLSTKPCFLAGRAPKPNAMAERILEERILADGADDGGCDGTPSAAVAAEHTSCAEGTRAREELSALAAAVLVAPVPARAHAPTFEPLERASDASGPSASSRSVSGPSASDSSARGPSEESVGGSDSGDEGAQSSEDARLSGCRLLLAQLETPSAHLHEQALYAIFALEHARALSEEQLSEALFEGGLSLGARLGAVPLSLGVVEALLLLSTGALKASLEPRRASLRSPLRGPLRDVLRGSLRGSLRESSLVESSRRDSFGEAWRGLPAPNRVTTGTACSHGALHRERWLHLLLDLLSDTPASHETRHVALRRLLACARLAPTTAPHVRSLLITHLFGARQSIFSLMLPPTRTNPPDGSRPRRPAAAAAALKASGAVASGAVAAAWLVPCANAGAVHVSLLLQAVLGGASATPRSFYDEQQLLSTGTELVGCLLCSVMARGGAAYTARELLALAVAELQRTLRHFGSFLHWVRVLCARVLAAIESQPDSFWELVLGSSAPRRSGSPENLDTLGLTLSTLDELAIGSASVWALGDASDAPGGGRQSSAECAARGSAAAPSAHAVAVASGRGMRAHLARALVGMLVTASLPPAQLARATSGELHAGWRGVGAVPLSSPLMRFAAEPTSFRLLLQWLLLALIDVWAPWAGTPLLSSPLGGRRETTPERALLPSHLMLPSQLLLWLLAPIGLPHATAPVLLASLGVLGASLPASGLVLLDHLLWSKGPTSHSWLELLPEGAELTRLLEVRVREEGGSRADCPPLARPPIDECWARVLRLALLGASLAAVRSEQAAAARCRASELEKLLSSHEPAADAARLLQGVGGAASGGGAATADGAATGDGAALGDGAATGGSRTSVSAGAVVGSATTEAVVSAAAAAEHWAGGDEGVSIHPSLTALQGEGRRLVARLAQKLLRDLWHLEYLELEPLLSAPWLGAVGERGEPPLLSPPHYKMDGWEGPQLPRPPGGGGGHALAEGAYGLSETGVRAPTRAPSTVPSE